MHCLTMQSFPQRTESHHHHARNTESAPRSTLRSWRMRMVPRCAPVVDEYQASKSVDGMPRVIISHDLVQECHICLEELKVGDEATKVPCKCKRIYFHRLCLQKWCLVQPSCPVCYVPCYVIINYTKKKNFFQKLWCF
ncbi:unnamed protein product [Prunus armeniaca]